MKTSRIKKEHGGVKSLLMRIGILILLLVSVHLINPTKIDLIKCGFKELTGYSCPTCGFTRAFYSLSNFEIIDSFYHNPFLIVIILLVIIIQLKRVIEVFALNRYSKQIYFPSTRTIVPLVFICWMAFWLINLIGKV
jgi:hypothetical protein